MDSRILSLNVHNIFLVGLTPRNSRGKLTVPQAKDYKGSFDDIFKRKGMPRKPSFYVNVPSRVFV